MKKDALATWPLPTATLRFSSESSRPADTDWRGRTQVHSDDEGDTYLVIPCQHVEVSVALGSYDEAKPELERFIKLCQERLAEINEMLA